MTHLQKYVEMQDKRCLLALFVLFLGDVSTLAHKVDGFVDGKVVANPENVTLIWNGWINFRFVDRALTDQKDIPWFEMVGFSLDVIGDFSGKKDDDLVKVMIMIRNRKMPTSIHFTPKME